MRFCVKEFESMEFNNNRMTIGIGVNSKGIILPSPLTNFIKRESRNKGLEINSQRALAYCITRFLNYLLDRIETQNMYPELKIGGLKHLKLQHAGDYITHLSIRNRNEGLSKSYINNDIKYLIKFFTWLKKEKIILDNFLIPNDVDNPRKLSINIRVRRVANLFDINDIDIIYPLNNSLTKTRVRDFGKNRIPLILLFLDIAQGVDPSLAFGIALQFFGGLRRSEVINIKKENINWHDEKLSIVITDNQSELFSNYSSSTDIQVKRNRVQHFICNEILIGLYEKHKKYLPTNGNHLFANKSNKGPCTGKQYWARFNKIKKEFLETLLFNNNLEDYLYLSENAWSTHIGRGIFTNLLLSRGLTAEQLMLARGDKNKDSSQSYLDERNTIESMNLVINNFKSYIKEGYKF